MTQRLVAARAPLRLGLAGGGTDVEPYCSQFGGHVLNATISRYAYAYLERAKEGVVRFCATDRHARWEGSPDTLDQTPPDLRLHRGVYERMMRQFHRGEPLALSLTTVVDAPAGSGLGTSSTLVVAMVQAFAEFLQLPLGEYDVAQLAYEIERIDCGLSGGKQDQYSAAFGGFNFMEFLAGDRVVVNPLRVKEPFVIALESSLVLYFTGVSRESARIIDEQRRQVSAGAIDAIDATHAVKAQASVMKEAILRGNLQALAGTLRDSWQAKKRMAQGITNPVIDTAYDAAIAAGAWAGKVSGAGGGGFMMFVVDPLRRMDVIEALQALGGQVYPFSFCERGATAWRVR